LTSPAPPPFGSSRGRADRGSDETSSASRVQTIGDSPLDLNEPVQLAERVWWVGHYQEQDAFQCHVYLIEQGDQSVLLDPGSRLTFRYTLAKIEKIIPFSRIRYFVCHHQDPDIAAAMPIIDEMVGREDAVLVTHWRARMLLKHYGLRMPFWLVDEHGWTLPLQDRALHFIFTPYAHFPGAFCTFDAASQILFSSDLFGGLTEEFSLVAKDEGYFDALRPFHEHYMPSRDILGYALAKIQEHPVRVIAPQHGSILTGPLVQQMVDRLKTLDCGLYLMARESTDIQRLSQLNRALRDVTETMMLYRDFSDIAERLVGIAQRSLPADGLEFYVRLDDGSVVHLAPESGYRGGRVLPDPLIAEILATDRDAWFEANPTGMSQCRVTGLDGRPRWQLVLPLFAPAQGNTRGIAILHLREPMPPGDDFLQVVDQMRVPLHMAVEREAIFRLIDMERQRFYEISIRDPLTGLFSRFYMQDMVQRLCSLQDRDPNASLGVAMVDVDHFKRINDSYGHHRGDDALRAVANVLSQGARGSDLPVRLGGEEFAVFVMGESAHRIGDLGERIRARVAELVLEGVSVATPLTVSVGTALRQRGEALDRFLERADAALYEAKRAGRNRVCMAPDG
jgi:diguanylate cyclase (GGDEF)-like protein